MRDIITGLFEKNAAGEGKPRWGDKTPYYVCIFPKLLEWWPDAQIIHIVRDGRDVALSMFARRHDFRAYNTYHAAKQWEQYVETGHALGQARSQSAISGTALRGHDQRPDSRLAGYLCIPRGGLFGRLAGLQKIWRGWQRRLCSRNPFRKSNQDKWKHGMTPWQIRVFESAAGAYARGNSATP